MNQCVIARHINGITLNGYEYILDDSGEIKVFENKVEAVSFLKSHGCIDEEIEYFRFFNHSQLQKDIYEEVA